MKPWGDLMRRAGWLALAATTLSMLSPMPSHALAATSPPISPKVAAGGGWNWQNPLPQGNTLNGVSCTGYQTCIAVGDMGTIIATSTGGDGWWSMQSSTISRLNAITCPTASACYVTGDNGTILASTNGGIMWKNQTSGVTIHAGSISCPTTTTCFVLTYADYPVWSGPILRTTDGGTTWVALSETTTTRWGQGISCPNATTCFAIAGGGVIVTTNGGATWTAPGGPASLAAIVCPGLNTCYAPDGSGTMEITANGGASWTTTALPPPFATGIYPLSVSCPTIAACLAAGWYGYAAATTNGGATWTLQRVPTLQANGNVNGVSCQTANSCTAVGIEGAIATTSNFGGYWSLRTTYFADDVMGVSCPSATSCVGVTSLGAVVATTNGATWFYRNAHFNVSLKSVSCPGSTTCYAVGAGGTIAGTTDGLAWSSQTSNTTNAFFGVTCPSLATCFAVGDGGTILATSNGGATWGSQTSSTISRISAISCPSATTCFAVGSTILATTDGGSHWSSQASSSGTVAINCPTATTCFAVGAQVVLTTTNGGTTWSSRSVSAGLSGVYCQTATTCTAVGVNGTYPFGGLIIATGDGGVTWSSTLSNASYGLNAVTCPGATLCYAVGGAGAILASTGATADCGSVALTSDKPSPQPGGTTVTFTASAPNCPYANFEFYTWSAPSGWVLRQAYSSSAQFVLDTTGMAPGTYTVDVWVKWYGAPPWFGGYDGFGLEPWVVGGCDSASLAPNPSPTSGTQTFTVTATGLGCSKPQYQFWLWSPSTYWVLEQPYSATNAWSLNIDQLASATYTVDVWVKQSGSPVPYETWALSSIPKGACGVTTVSSALSSPQLVGTTVNFTASAPGCTTPSFQYWIYPGPQGAWNMLRDYATGGTYNWDTTGYRPGTQSIVVHTRQAGSTADYDTDGLVSYTVMGCSTASLSASTINAQGAITLQATAPGCTAPQYQFWIYPPGGPWTVLQEFSPNSTYVWTPTAVGSYALVVYVKQQGSGNAFDSFALVSDTVT